MPKKTTRPVKPPQSDTAATKTRVSQSAKAAEVVNALRVLREAIQGFAIIAAPKQYGTRFSIDPKFIEAMCVVVERFPRLAAACSLNPDEAREVIAFEAAFAAVEREAELLRNGVHGARVARYVEIVKACDQAYEILKALAHSPEGAELVPYARQIKEARKLRRNPGTRARRRAKETNAAATPVSPRAAGANGSAPPAE